MLLFVTGRNTGRRHRHLGPERQVFLDKALRHRMNGHEPDLAPLAPDPEVHHALTALHVPDPATSFEVLPCGVTVGVEAPLNAITDPPARGSSNATSFCNTIDGAIQ